MISYDEETLAAVRRMIDYEASGLRMFFDECEREGDLKGDTRRKYQSDYNTLVTLREKMTPAYMETVSKWDGHEATARIFIDDEGKETKQ